MPKSRYAPVPVAVAEDRLAWLDQAESGEAGDHELLISGLRAGDANRWQIGVLDARIDREAGYRPHIALRFAKPLPKNSLGANLLDSPNSQIGSTEYIFDPESVFVMQAHILFGGTLGIKTSKERYFYPMLKLANGSSVRFSRFIMDARSTELARINVADYHDYRRWGLGQFMAQHVARRRYKEQKGGPYRVRRDFVDLAVKQHSLTIRSERLATPALYRRLLVGAYRLLDKRNPMDISTLHRV